LLGVLRGGLVEFVRPGESDLSGRELVSVGRIALTGVIVAVNLIGAAAVVGVAMFVVPLPAVAHTGHVRMVNVWLAVAYVLIAVPVGVVLGTRSLKPMENWLLEERPARDDEQRVLVRAPLRLFMVQLVLWLIAATLFGVVNAAYSSRLAVIVVVVVSFTGATTATCAYLIVERLLRAAAVRALVEATPERLAGPGVATRELLTWALSTGVPVAGVVALGVMSLAGYSASARQLAVAMVVLGGVALAVGLVSVTIAARATADPIDSVRRAMAQVAHGQFDVRVPVYDGTQIGQLQLGFNNMAGGLAERERIRDVFGTYVDSEVATRILQGDGDLEGEEVEVTVMFLDVRAFTAYAEQTSARVVVATLNRLFERVVPPIYDHGGFVNKFIGDGLLAVFGAPRRFTDHADRALGAALEIEQLAKEGLPGGLQIGIGLNSGPVLAGNIGGGHRLEYSVIGDVVNVAARVETATRETGDTILLSAHTRALLRSGAEDLCERTGVALKGKSELVALFAPAAGEVPAV
jgi:adenylate cyclase